MSFFSIAKRAQIREHARATLTEVWKRRGELWDRKPTEDSFFPISVGRVIRGHLGLTLWEPDSIATQQNERQIAGVLDRSSRTIQIAQKMPDVVRRFTGAHEVAHWHLHKQDVLFRDVPLYGGERANEGRPIVEQEADLFAAEFLMPTKMVEKEFLARFVRLFTVGDSRFEYLAKYDHRISVEQLNKDLRYRSATLARWSHRQTNVIGGALCERFGVSMVAMAIQLEDLGLVQ